MKYLLILVLIIPSMVLAVNKDCKRCTRASQLSRTTGAGSKIAQKLMMKYHKCSAGVGRQQVVNREPSCKDNVKWATIKAKTFKQFEKGVTNNVAKASNNVGAGVFYFPGKSKPKTVYRSAFLGAGKSGRRCLEKLMDKRGVKTVVNLYTGSFRSYKQFEKDEKDIVTKRGGNYEVVKNFEYRTLEMYLAKIKKLQKYIYYLGTKIPIKHKLIAKLKKKIKKYRKKKFTAQSNKELMVRIADVVSLIGSKPGDALFHCMGGMHRTGIVFGVMRKCLSRPKAKVSDILSEYKCHVAYQGPSVKKRGGYKKINEEIIKKFPCDLFDPKKREAARVKSYHLDWEGEADREILNPEAGTAMELDLVDDI